MLHVRELRVDKNGRTICHVPELEVARGERVAVVGPNGSGKTTFLRVVSGLERAFTGECGVDVPLGSRVYVHQSPYMFRGSVLFNAAYGLAARRVPRRERKAIAQDWLEAFGVGHLAGRRTTHLSGGERRRVALARAFATGADLLIIDEPLADLDEEGIGIVSRVVGNSSDTTVLISSPVPLPQELQARCYVLGRNY